MFDHVPVQTVSPRWLSRHRLEDEEAAAAPLGDVLDADGRRDLVAGDDERAPDELLPGVHEAREVDPDLGVEHPLRDGRHRVDDREHRRRDDVGVAGLARGLDVEVQRVGLAHGAGVLAHLLAPDRVHAGRIGLADDVGVDGHEAAAVCQRALQMKLGTVPPSADHAAPATVLARAEQRKTITAAISSGSAKRPSGTFACCAASASSRETPRACGGLVGEPALGEPQRRAHRPRRDGVDEHAVADVAVGEVARERQLRGLRHRVGDVRQRRALARRRADVDDPPAARPRPSAARPRA